MPGIAWPAQLPQAPASWNEQPSPVAIWTENDSGPSKSRLRFTKPKRTASMSFLLTIEQYIILDDFYNLTLKGGTIPMVFTHPWRKQAKDMYIKEPPAASNESALGVTVQVRLEYY